ncbi:hypothetical protein CKO15_12930 [Halorhodospira abdelmalekii]|nr:hypothetical protein [Halorhodospira abdelmalekii]
MDERWELEDLYGFPHAYSQSHAFIYCFDSGLDPRNAKRIDTALEGYPWRGGYSYVNIYTVLHHQIPVPHRPQIAAIQYASPGWIDILLNPDVALQVAKSVGILLGAGVAAVEAIKRIDKARLEMAYQRRKKRGEFAALSAAEAKALNEMSEEVAKHLGFGGLASLNERTKNPEVTLKLLLAHYRRLRVLGEYVESGKIALPEKLRDES